MAARSASTAPTRVSRGRINMLLLFSMLVAALCGSRLFQVQVVRHEELSSMAESEIEREDTLLPRRGVIRDNQGTVLAMNIERESLWVNPRLIDEAEEEKLSLTLAPLIGKAEPEVYQILSDKQLRHVRLARWLSPEVSASIRALEQPGLELIPEPQRVYPLNGVAAALVGVSNWEGEGISGIEAFYNDLLKGTPGTLRAERDAAQRPIAIGPQSHIPARHGADLTLTIDPTVQKLIEEELKQGIERNNASGGSIVVMEPDTGAILGMASWPYFDPNRYTDYPIEVYNRNAAVTDLYEPGSTFKMINVAIGLDSGKFTPNTIVNDPGMVERYGWPLRNWDGGGNGPIAPADVLKFSSNVGALQLAEISGPDTFYEYLRRFGYGEPTGIDLAGEQAGIVPWPEMEGWSPLTLATNGYGQSISMTPLQHLRAISAIANGGKLMQPYLVKQWCQDEVCHEVQPRLVRQAVSRETTDLVKPMLVRAANESYAPLIWGDLNPVCPIKPVPLVPGYNVAAKTGTSSIPDSRGGYEDTATIGSVAGFAPAENPRIAVLVKVDRPKDIWGVRTAIPIYYEVVSKLMLYYRLQPDPSLFDECQLPAAGGQ